MQAYALPIRAGWDWIREGAALFRRQPLGLMVLFVTFIFVVALLTRIPVAGVVLPALLYPGLSLSFMVACRDIADGKRVLPTTLVAPFHEHGGRAARPLLMLGALFLLAFVLTMLATLLVDGGQFLRAGLGLDPSAEATLNKPEVSRAMLIALALQIPVTLSFWFAPALVAWHQVAPVKALFFSIVAAWRNLGPFFVYGCALTALMFVGLGVLTAVLQSMGMSQQLQLFVYSPLSIAFTSIVYCSVYASYRTTFAIDRPDKPAA